MGLCGKLGEMCTEEISDRKCFISSRVKVAHTPLR